MSNWIAQATSGAHGQFKAKAKKAGMKSVPFAHKVKASPKKFDKVTRQQAQLLVNMMGNRGAAPAGDAESPAEDRTDKGEQ